MGINCGEKIGRWGRTLANVRVLTEVFSASQIIHFLVQQTNRHLSRLENELVVTMSLTRWELKTRPLLKVITRLFQALCTIHKCQMRFNLVKLKHNEKNYRKAISILVWKRRDTTLATTSSSRWSQKLVSQLTTFRTGNNLQFAIT